MLGSGGMIVMDDSTDMVYQIMRLARFYAHESCAQCTQCREGTAWTTRILERILAGKGKPEDLDLLLDLSENMTGKTICVLSDSCAAPVVSGIKKFRGGVRGVPESDEVGWRGELPVELAGPTSMARQYLSRNMSELVNVTIDGMPVSVPKGTHASSRPPSRPASSCRTTAITRRCRRRRSAGCAWSRSRRRPSSCRPASRPWPRGRWCTSTASRPRRRARACSSSCSSIIRSTVPICDQAGECELQNYVFQEGRSGTRYSEYAKRYNPVEDFGPDVLYVPNRCILCTRCVRFMEDVAGEAGPERLRARRPGLHRHRPRSSSSTIRGPATWWISARSARSSPRTSCTRRGPGTWTRPPASAPAARQGCNITIDTRDDDGGPAPAAAQPRGQPALHLRPRAG